MELHTSSLVHYGFTSYKMIEKIEERMEDIGELELEDCDSPSWFLNFPRKNSRPTIQFSENG